MDQGQRVAHDVVRQGHLVARPQDKRGGSLVNAKVIDAAERQPAFDVTGEDHKIVRGEADPLNGPEGDLQDAGSDERCDQHPCPEWSPAVGHERQHREPRGKRGPSGARATIHAKKAAQ